MPSPAPTDTPIMTQTGKIIKSRLPDSESAFSVFNAFRQNDQIASLDRARANAVIDGFAPYNQGDLEAAGQGERFNVNWGDANAAVNASLVAYNDLTNSTDTLVRFSTKWGDKSSRMETEMKMAEAFSWLNRKLWGAEYEYWSQLNASFFVKEGPSLVYFPNMKDWRYRSARIGEFLIPGDTFASEEYFDICFLCEQVRVHELYGYIKDERKAKRLGWNVAAVKDAIINYCGPDAQNVTSNQWERIEELLKNKDYSYSYARSEKVRIVHCLVKEYDGTVSHHIMLEQFPEIEYLYTRVSAYKKMHHFLTLFKSEIGNGYLKSIRGLGYKGFAYWNAINRLKCQLAESAAMSGTFAVQPGDEVDFDKLQVIQYGPYAVIPAGLKKFDWVSPNLNTSLIPAIQYFNNQLDNNTGSYATRQVAPSTERTKFEVQAQIATEATLTTGQMNMYYLSLKRVYTEQIRRLKNFGKTYYRNEPGGEEAYEFFLRLKEMGVPRTAFDQIYDTEPVRAIGYGSAGNRLLALDKLTSKLGMMDPVGRNNALRADTAATLGTSEVDQFFPKAGPDQRPVIDKKIAILENGDLAQGHPVEVEPNEDHYVHAVVHLNDAQSIEQQINDQKLVPEQGLPFLSTMIPHVAQHLQYLGQDMSRKAEVAQLNKIFPRIVQFTKGIAQNVQKQQLAQAQAQQEMQQPQTEDKIKMMKAQAEIQRDNAVTQSKIKNKALEVHQSLVLKDLKHSQEITQNITDNLTKPKKGK